MSWPSDAKTKKDTAELKMWQVSRNAYSDCIPFRIQNQSSLQFWQYMYTPNINSLQSHFNLYNKLAIKLQHVLGGLN